MEYIKFNNIRSECKNSLENLEIWLRNIIDYELKGTYGDEYWVHSDSNGNNLLSKKVVEEPYSRFISDSTRYSRLVDAFFLDDLIKIACNPKLYNDHFKNYLSKAFPNGSENTRFFLNQLINIRNNLSHSNPISNHDALKVLCYSNDVIGSIKEHLKTMNMEKKFNSPSIINICDSYGNNFPNPNTRKGATGVSFCDTRKNDFELFVGDQVSIEVVIDPTFNDDEYDLKWNFRKIQETKPTISGTKISFELQDIHVNELFGVNCKVISKKSWHRFSGFDDSVTIAYRVRIHE